MERGNSEKASDGLERWFTDPRYGSDFQDFDLVLADKALFPRLSLFLDDSASPESKKIEVISALLELLEHACPKEEGVGARKFANEIVSVIKKHSTVAENSVQFLGPVKAVVIRKILALPIQPDFPRWVIALADNLLPPERLKH